MKQIRFTCIEEKHNSFGTLTGYVVVHEGNEEWSCPAFYFSVKDMKEAIEDGWCTVNNLNITPSKTSEHLVA